MGSNGVVLASAQSLPESSIGDRDAYFRARLEGSVDVAFRLAAVILGSSADPEETTQDVMERAWRSRHTLREDANFEAWFQRIVVNACRDRLRRVRSSPSLVSIEVHEDAA